MSDLLLNLSDVEGDLMARQREKYSPEQVQNSVISIVAGPCLNLVPDGDVDPDGETDDGFGIDASAGEAVAEEIDAEEEDADADARDTTILESAAAIPVAIGD